MGFSQYIRLILPWWWLIALFGAIGGGLSYYLQSQQPVTYVAEARVLIGSAPVTLDPSPQDLSVATGLVDLYVEVANKHDVIQATINELGLDLSVGSVRRKMSVRLISGTSILVIGISDSESRRAALLANSLARQLIANSPSNITDSETARLVIAQQQLDDLIQQREQLRVSVTSVDESLRTATDADRIENLTARRVALIDQINDTSANIASFAAIISDIENPINSLQVFEIARIPDRPQTSNTLLAVAIAIAMGLVFAVGAIILVEYLNDTVKTASEATNLLGISVIGLISNIGKWGEYREDKLVLSGSSGGQLIEQYRTLRTNLQLAVGDQDRQLITVMSALPNEGKSLTAANLAAAYAMSHMTVCLVDTDLRNPTLHSLLDLPNDNGLVDAVLTMEQGNDVGDQFLQQTKHKNLKVVTTGDAGHNLDEVLSSPHMKTFIDHLLDQFDIVLLDCPPMLSISDGVMLSEEFGANVLMILRAGKTPRTTVQQAIERLQLADVQIAGWVLNGAKMLEDYYGYNAKQSQPKQPKRSNKPSSELDGQLA